MAAGVLLRKWSRRIDKVTQGHLFRRVSFDFFFEIKLFGLQESVVVYKRQGFTQFYLRVAYLSPRPLPLSLPLCVCVCVFYLLGGFLLTLAWQVDDLSPRLPSSCIAHWTLDSVERNAHCWPRISRGKTQHAQIAWGFASLPTLVLHFYRERERWCQRVGSDRESRINGINGKKTNVIPRLHHVPTDISCAQRL